MPPRVRILLPRSLRVYWTNVDEDSVEMVGATLSDVVTGLGGRWPGLAARILDDRGRLREHVLIFVNGRLASHGDLADVPLADGDTIRVVPAVSGGHS